MAQVPPASDAPLIEQPLSLPPPRLPLPPLPLPPVPVPLPPLPPPPLPPLPPLPDGSARSGDSAMSGGAVTVTIKLTGWLAVVPVAVTVTVFVSPTMAVGEAATVIVEVPPLDIADAGLNETTRSVTEAAVSFTVSELEPVASARVSFAVAMPPTGTLSVVGATVAVKSFTTIDGLCAMQAF